MSRISRCSSSSRECNDAAGLFPPVSRAGILFGRYARLVGAPNCAPSLRSVAGLLLALALESAYEDILPLPLEIVNCIEVASNAQW
jgi:hypothetical protein